MNKVFILGFVGKDPEVRNLGDDSAVTTLSVATTEVTKDSYGNKKEVTDWHSVVLWKQQATFAGSYIKKGSQVLVEGRIKYRTYTDKSGNERRTTEIVANSIQLLGKKDASANSDYRPKEDDMPY